MAILPDKKVFDTLDSFFAAKTIQSVNRDVYSVCNLQDHVNKITVSLIFMRDWDGIEYDKYDHVIIENKGAVLVFPSYWLSVPKELAFEHFVNIVNKFYADYVTQWISNNNSSSNDPGIGSGSSNNSNNCVCYPPCNLV